MVNWYLVFKPSNYLDYSLYFIAPLVASLNINIINTNLYQIYEEWSVHILSAGV